MNPIRVLIVSEDPLLRAGLAALLGGREGLVAGSGSTDGFDVVAWAPGAEPDAAALQRAALAGLPIVALVADAEQAAAALRAGARGIVHRGADAPTLAAALTAAAAGLTVLEPSLASDWLRPPGAAKGEEPLTPREREVLGLLAEGLGNKAIAARLAISEHTAKFHVNAILAKLGAGSRAEAIVLAARQGLVIL